MDKEAYEFLIDFTMMIHYARSCAASQVADELILQMNGFMVEIEPLRDSRPKDHAFIAARAKTSLMAALSHSSATGMDALDIVRVMEAGFTNGGIFAGQPFPALSTTSDEICFLAASYFMAMNHPKLCVQSADEYLLAVSALGFRGGEPFKRLVDELQRIERARPGQSKVETTYFLVSEIHMNPRFGVDTALTLLAHGGLDRCREIGIAPRELMDKMMHILQTAPASVTDFSKIHGFCSKINDYLFSNLGISHKTFVDYSQKLLTLVLTMSKAWPQKGEGLLESAGPIEDMSLSLNQMLQVASLSSKNDIHFREKLSTSAYEEAMIKAEVRRLDAGVQYQVINRLDLKSLYSPRELHRMNGQRLEHDLGM